MSEAEFTCDEGDYLAWANSPERQEKKALRELGIKNKKEAGMSNEKIKPCPFCGGKAKHQQFDNLPGELHTIACCKCKVAKCGSTLKEAIAAWNKRVKEDL